MEIEGRLAELAGELNALEAELVGVVAAAVGDESWRGDGIRSVSHWLVIHLGCSPSRARQIETSATRVGEFPVLGDKFRRGEVSHDQFHVVASQVPAWADSEAADMAPHATVPQLRRIVRDQFPPDPEPDRVDDASDADASPTKEPVPPVDLLDDRLGYSWNANGRLVGSFDLSAPSGILFEAAISEAQDHLFHQTGEAASGGDALVEVTRRSAGAVSDGRIERFKHLIHINTDKTRVSRPRADGAKSGRCRVTLTNGVNLPQSVADYLGCDATMRPVWETDSVPVGVGRTQRSVPLRLRRLITYRDQGCRVPGCGMSHVEIHHIEHWNEGGATESNNLVSLCVRHHKQHHNDRLTIFGNPDDDTLWFGDHHGQPLRTGPKPKPVDTRRWRTNHGVFVHPTGERFQIDMMSPWQPPNPETVATTATSPG